VVGCQEENGGEDAMSWEGILKRKSLHINRGSYQPPSSSKTPFESEGLMQITYKVWPRSDWNRVIDKKPSERYDIASTYVVEAEDVEDHNLEANKKLRELVERDFPNVNTKYGTKFHKHFHWEKVDEKPIAKERIK